jgi:gliding motility-associated-like protein
MKDLEKIVKQSFDSFEPEVSPEIWQRLEQGLESAAVSSSAASSSAKVAVKGAAVKGSVWGWVTGAVVTASVVTALVLSSGDDRKQEVVATVLAEQTTGSEEKFLSFVPDFITYNSLTGAYDVIFMDAPKENLVENPEKQTKSQQNKKIIPAVSESLSNKENTEDGNSSSGLTPSSESHAPSSSNAVTGHPESDQSVKSKEVTPDRAIENESPASQENSNLDKEVPVKIIIKSSYGFAPFKVTALLNNETAKGSWDFGDGNATLSSNSASHTYNKPGKYMLTCRTEKGEELTRPIEVLGTVSNVFTPNGDGQNDEFYVDAPFLEELSVKIYGRTGRMEYEITSPGQRWDGKDQNGKELPEGTYFYDIFARSGNGQMINQRGTINIYRLFR